MMLLYRPCTYIIYVYILYIMWLLCENATLTQKSIWNTKTEQLLKKFKYNINGQYLNEGVFVSSDWNWDKWVSQVCSMANILFKMTSKCFVFKTKDLIRKLYTTLIRPKLEYAHIIWFPGSKSMSSC